VSFLEDNGQLLYRTTLSRYPRTRAKLLSRHHIQQNNCLSPQNLYSEPCRALNTMTANKIPTTDSEKQLTTTSHSSPNPIPHPYDLLIIRRVPLFLLNLLFQHHTSLTQHVRPAITHGLAHLQAWGELQPLACMILSIIYVKLLGVVPSVLSLLYAMLLVHMGGGSAQGQRDVAAGGRIRREWAEKVMLE
jgi:hypothetical protein